MATWFDKLARVTLPPPDGRELIGASFRSVPFFVSSAERTGGRRAMVHEFPFRDVPNVEDLGRIANVYRVEGYVVGDKYLDAKDALLAALQDTPGAGEMVHPYYGRRRVICTGLTTRESVKDGGMASFQIEFRDAPAAPAAPTETTDLPGKVDSDADDASSDANDEFLGQYDVDGQPSFALASLNDELGNVAEALRAPLADVVSDAQELAILTVEIDLFVAQASSLARQPADVVGELVDIIRTLAETVIISPLAISRALMTAYATPAVDLAPGATATRTQERVNQTALAGVLRQILVIEAARLLPLATFETLDEALADQQVIADALDAQAATATDVAYTGLVTLRASLTRAVPGDTVLARIQTINRAIETPSLLLSYQLYGSVDQEVDIIDRNAVRYPGFIAGDVQVLSDV